MNRPAARAPRSRSHRFAGLAAGTLGASLASATAGASLFAQLPVEGVAGISRLTPNPPSNPTTFVNRQLADNFTLDADASIDLIRWWGGDETAPGDNNPNPPLFNLLGFTLRVYDEAPDGNPGNLVFQTQGSVGQTFSSISATPEGATVGLLFAERYRFERAIDPPLELEGNKRYFLVVAAQHFSNNLTVDNQLQTFLWASADPGDETTIAQDRFDGDGLILRNLSITNTAFQLVGTPIETPCPGDADGDAAVGTSDLLILLANWGQQTTSGPQDGDFDNSNSVGTADLLVLLAAWGTSC
jgi:hypothetical protein